LEVPTLRLLVLVVIVVLKVKKTEEHRRTGIDRGKPEFSEESLSSATVFVINVAQTGLGSITGQSGG
jgi:hypothetical protein